MGTHYLAMFPEEPEFVPDSARLKQAVELYESLLTNETAPNVMVTDEVEFIHGMENYAGVDCPLCGADLDRWWGDAMDRAWDGSLKGFGDLACQVPCCGGETSLNSLAYRSPAGFARFVLMLYTELDPEGLAELEAILGCRLRQTWVHL